MFRKIMENFTATHFTILAGIAIVAPCTLAYGVVSYQPVAIVNANTGYKASVDTNGRLFTYDPVVDPSLGYVNNPMNIVSAYNSCSGGTTSTVYTVPGGKALIIKNANFSYYSGTSGGDNYSYLAADGIFVASVEGSDVAGDNSASLGVYAKNSVTLSCGSSGAYLAAISGYLVPLTALPPSAEAAEHEGRPSARPMKAGHPL